MKYKDIHIQYDKNGDLTKKFGKDAVSVLILPNAQVLTSYTKYSS